MADLNQEQLQTQYGNLAVAPVAPVNPAYAPSASNVYSPSNVQQTMTAPLAPPNYSDPFGLYNYYYNTPDVVAARKDVNDLNSQLAQFKTQTNQQQNYLENQTVAMPVITGEQANQLRLRGTQQQGIADALLAKQSYLDTATTNANNLYQIAQGERNKLQDLITQTSGKAGISYADSYETALQKADKYTTQVAEDAKKQKYKDALKAAALDLGLKTKGSTKELEKRISKSKKSAVSDAKKLADIEYQLKVKELKKPYYEPKDAPKLDLTNAGLAKMIEEEKNAGTSWADTVAKIASATGNTNAIASGSFTDNYLKYLNGYSKINPLTK